ncbi:beta-lactamase-like protein [Penicillium cf. viridicatum]|uniref:Beta-lactamase-like protein n=1 Tax=Penicillium cf. viridicatum TaxID=2972119 RepID=A0A9W9T424_9EURO|nr:beta-lactamase-like protein [Penicillium cf. viridicatum]
MSPSNSQSRGVEVPPSDHCIYVRAMNTTTRMVCDAEAFVQPVIRNHTKLNFPTLCFLLERQTANGIRYILYDLGARKDFWNGTPISKSMIGKHVFSLEVEKGVQDVLRENGVDLNCIDAIVWSHWHWDHIGDASKFPDSVDLVVGPGFKENFLPGWPENPDSPLLTKDLAGHKIYEPDFPLKIGGFRAHDYFGDGSFYILDVPGHAIGHVCGLARTTPTTFVFLGGDCCHFAGAFRPSPSYPIPEYLRGAGLDISFPRPCPCSLLTGIHPIAKSAEAARSQPFYEVSRAAGSAYTFGDDAQESINRLQPFDSDPNVFILLAHDSVLFDVLPLFNDHPDLDINDWQQKGYKGQTHWGFLNELPRNNRPGRKPLVNGLRRNGRLLVYGDDGDFHEQRSLV